jgi:DNA invertase Pin-like site-specific DNA recombinase
MSNALGAARLSHDTDASTSIERQVESIGYAAKSRQDSVIYVAQDVDVSGSVSPFERDDLGPWLTDPEKIAQWDVMYAVKVDRLTRDLGHFLDLLKWFDAHGKILRTIDDSIDLSNETGKMFAKILALFAEFERSRIGERRRDAGKKLRTSGFWEGGPVPLGLAVEKQGDRFVYIVDDASAARVREMASKIMAGKSARSVGMPLGQDAGVVINILRNPALAGVVTYGREVVRDSDGMPARRDARIFSDDEWDKLQAALNKNSTGGKGKSEETALMLGVITCGKCGENLFISRRPAGAIYRHGPRSQCSGTISAKQAEGALESRLMALVGDTQQVELLPVKGEAGHIREELKRVEKAIGDIESAVEAGDMPASSAGRMLGRLESKLTGLQAKLATADEDTVREVPTGITYRQAWEAMDTAERAAWLRDSGIRFVVGGDLTVIADARMYPVGAFYLGRADVQKPCTIEWGVLNDLGNRAQAA